jgi:hypothetical protein
MQTGRTVDPVLARVADDLGRGVEAHRLGVEQRAGEDAAGWWRFSQAEA